MPGEPTTTLFEFSAQSHEIRVRLLYRRFWEDVAKAKDWPPDEIVVFDRRYPTRASKPNP
jgi:hypothetical protein